MIERDYLAEMRQIIDSETASPPYTRRDVAQRIVEKLTATDPDLLHGWLREQAPALLVEMISAIDRSRRAHLRHQETRSVFANAASKAEAAIAAGDMAAAASAFAWLETVYVVDDENTCKRLAQMNGTDLNYVADRYERRAKESQLEAHFHRALAQRVGDSTVADVFNEAELRRMRESLRSI